MATLTVLNTNVSDMRLAERLLTSWSPDQRVPAESAASLPSAITEAEALTTAIDGKTLAVLLMQTFKIWNPPDDIDDTAQFYREALEDVPLDLVQAALKHLRQTLKWFPKPCELRAPIETELRRRRDVLRRLKLMELKVHRGDVEEPALRVVPTPEQKAEAEAIAAKTREVLENAGLKRVPGYDEDQQEHRPASLADAYKATKLKPGAWLDKAAESQPAEAEAAP
jgi:hypothetical protein